MGYNKLYFGTWGMGLGNGGMAFYPTLVAEVLDDLGQILYEDHGTFQNEAAPCLDENLDTSVIHCIGKQNIYARLIYSKCDKMLIFFQLACSLAQFLQAAIV